MASKKEKELLARVQDSVASFISYCELARVHKPNEYAVELGEQCEKLRPILTLTPAKFEKVRVRNKLKSAIQYCNHLIKIKELPEDGFLAIERENLEFSFNELSNIKAVQNHITAAQRLFTSPIILAKEQKKLDKLITAIEQAQKENIIANGDDIIEILKSVKNNADNEEGRLNFINTRRMVAKLRQIIEIWQKGTDTIGRVKTNQEVFNQIYELCQQLIDSFYN